MNTLCIANSSLYKKPDCIKKIFEKLLKNNLGDSPDFSSNWGDLEYYAQAIKAQKKLKQVVLCPPWGVKLTKEQKALYSPKISFETLLADQTLKELPEGAKLVMMVPQTFLNERVPGKLYKETLSKMKLSASIELPPNTIKISRLNPVLLCIEKTDQKHETLMYRFAEEIDDQQLEQFQEALNEFETKGSVAETEWCYSIEQPEPSTRWDFDYLHPEVKKDRAFLLSKNAKPLSELVEIVKVSSKEKFPHHESYEFVNLSDVSAREMRIVSSQSMTKEELPTRASFVLEEGDLLIASTGQSVGTSKNAIAYVDKNYHGAIATNAFKLLRKPQIDPYYLLYFFTTPTAQDQINRLKKGRLVPFLTDKDFAQILVPIPDEQFVSKICTKIKSFFDYSEKAHKSLAGLAMDYLHFLHGAKAVKKEKGNQKKK